MSKKRINILTTVSSANVSRDGDVITIRDVVHAVDGIVLNKRLYTGKELAKGVASLESRPAPAGHPKDSKGRHISASNGEALGSSWIGAWCVNSRYEGGRALCDIKANAAQASALPAGKEVVARLDAAIAGTNTDPIGVSSGLLREEVEAKGESLGKAYSSVATNMQFDHLAILLTKRHGRTSEDGMRACGSDGPSHWRSQPQDHVAAQAGPFRRCEPSAWRGTYHWRRRSQRRTRSHDPQRHLPNQRADARFPAQRPCRRPHARVRGTDDGLV